MQKVTENISRLSFKDKISVVPYEKIFKGEEKYDLVTGLRGGGEIVKCFQDAIAGGLALDVENYRLRVRRLSDNSDDWVADSAGVGRFPSTTRWVLGWE